MYSPSGRKRVIISNVIPSVNEGQYPAKAVVDQYFPIGADIFTDGQNEIAATALIKHKHEKVWREVPLKLINNDHWESLFQPSQLGTYQFQMQAWIDEYTTWLKNVQKKYEAGQDVAVELVAGTQIVASYLSRAKGKDKAILTKWTENLKRLDSLEEKITFIQANAIADHLNKCRDKAFTTVSQNIFEITVEPAKALFSTWYELFPRSASSIKDQHGTFNDVRALLPQLAAMSFDVLYLPPVHPIGFINRKGRNNTLIAGPQDPGSPWAIGSPEGGHTAIHPQLGTMRDFKRLIGDCKKHGMEIAMDIAFQCAPDHPYVKEHPEWFKWRADGTVQYAENPPKKYEDIFPFNFDSEDWEGLWQELKNIMLFWVNAGVNIFRVDNPHTKAFPFWEWAIKEIKAQHPQVIFLAEAFTRPRIMEHLAKIGFSQSYTYFSWRTTKQELQEYVTELMHTPVRYYFRPNFWPNTPDILPPYLTTENAHIIRLILAGTLSASYGVYGPVYELNVHEATPGKEEYLDNEKYEIRHWDWSKYTKTKELMGRLNKIRKENKALQDNLILFAYTDNNNIICYIKYDALKQNIVIVVVNLDPENRQEGTIWFPYDKVEHLLDNHYKVTDMLSGDKYEWNNYQNYVILNPYDMPAHIFKIEK